MKMMNKGKDVEFEIMKSGFSGLPHMITPKMIFTKKFIALSGVIWITIFVALLAFAGCVESQKVSSDELLKPRTTDTLFAQKWVNVYGDGSESVEHYNIALMLRIMNQQDTRIKKLEERADKLDNSEDVEMNDLRARIESLEIKADGGIPLVFDPNERAK